MKAPFKINNRIDLGTDGSFSPGSEPRLMAALKEKKDGEKVFQSLVTRGAIEIVPVKEPKKASKAGKKSTKKNETEDKDESESTAKEQEEKAPEKGDKPVDNDTEETDDEKADDKAKVDSESESDDDTKLEAADGGQPDYKPTGKWEKNGYGGGMFEIINPKGFVVDTIRGEDKADERITKENK